MRLSLGGLMLAAITAAGITWIVMMLGATVTVAAEASSENGLGLVVTVLVLMLFGLMIALSLGTVHALVGLTPAFLIAERIGTDRRRALLLAGAACGLAYPLLGFATQALGGSPLKVLSYAAGSWLWAGVYEGGANGILGTLVITLAPVMGGLAAGHVYEWLTRPQAKGLTTPEGGTI